MKEILRIDLKNYKEEWEIYEREAVKGIFFINDKLVMQQSKQGDVKFPGGGIELGEDKMACLKREIMEETGYNIIYNTIQEIGVVIEKRKDKYKDAIWEMVTHMYTFQVDISYRYPLSLTEHEIESGLECIFISPEEAIKINEDCLQKASYKEWLYRDLELLKKIFLKI